MSLSWPDYIHRELTLSKAERKSVFRTAWKLWLANRWNILLYLGLPVFYLLTVSQASTIGGRIATSVGLNGTALKLLRAIVPLLHLAFCFAGGGIILQRLRFAPCVYQCLRQHGMDVCHRCGYWLKGWDQTIRSCPDCGAGREFPVPPESSSNPEKFQL